MTIKRIKKELSFDMLVTLMKENRKVIFCGDSDDEPAIELTLEKDEIPHDLDEALSFVDRDWDDA